jgi:hypothetical protein
MTVSYMNNTMLKILGCVAVLTVITSTLLAGGPPPHHVPDGGSSALLAAISLFGLSLARKLRG